MPPVVLKLFAGQGTGRMDGRVPTLHIVSYFDGTDAFMSLHKLFYEFTNSFHAKYKPISCKCWLGQTTQQLYASRFGKHKNGLENKLLKKSSPKI